MIFKDKKLKIILFQKIILIKNLKNKISLGKSNFNIALNTGIIPSKCDCDAV